ncbi:hypothetical protein KGQ71_04660, partial [Patescibacteria group bacterium]|nr:hypothetical protein [Patescibacteria group bacterium]
MALSPLSGLPAFLASPIWQNLAIHPARAAIDPELPFSARLTTSAGFDVADGTYPVTFLIYSQATGGTPLWQETQTISVSRGEFAVRLGSVKSLASVDFNQSPLYLAFQVGTDPEMTPRYQIGAVPTALNSQELNGRDSSKYVQTDQNQTLSGNNTFTGTTTALTGTPAASSTTSLLQLGSALASGSAAGTYLGLNAASGFAGNLADLQVNGTSQFTVNNTGSVVAGSWQASTVGVTYGGTGAVSFTSNGVLYGNGAGALQVTAAGTSGQLLLANTSGVPTFVTVSGDATLAASGVLTLAASGATGGTYGSSSEIPEITVDTKGRITSVTTNPVIYASPVGTAGGDLSGSYPNPSVVKINGVALGTTTATAGNLLIGDGSQWSSVAVSGDGSLTSGGVFTIGSGAVTGSKIASSTITATNLQSGDYSSVITSGTYSIGISGNAGTVSNGVYTNAANTITAPSNAAVPLSLKPVAGTGTGDTLDLYNNAASPSIASYFDAAGLFHGSGAGISAASIANSSLANASVTVTAGTGLAGGGSVALGGSVTISNAGVTSISGTSNQVIASASTGSVTLSLPQDIATVSSPTFGGLTVNGDISTTGSGSITSASTVTGTTGINTGVGSGTQRIDASGNLVNIGTVTTSG